MSEDKKEKNGKKKGGTLQRLVLTVVGVIAAAVVALLGLSFGESGGGLVYIDEARDEQCSLFRGAGTLSSEDENSVRSDSGSISAKEAPESSDVVEVSGLPSGGGNPVYIVRAFGESDVVIREGVCFFTSVEAAVRAVENPVELQTTEEAAPEETPSGEVPLGEGETGDTGAGSTAESVEGSGAGGVRLSTSDEGGAVAEGREYSSIFDMPKTTPSLYIAGVFLIGLVVIGLWALRLSVERTKYTDTLTVEGTLDGKGRGVKDAVDKVPGEYTVDCDITVRNADAMNPSLLILRRMTSLRQVWLLARPIVRDVISSHGKGLLLTEYVEMETAELEEKVRVALRKLEKDQQVEFEIVLSNADLKGTSRAWLNRMRNVEQYASEYADFCSRLNLDVHDFNTVLVFLGKSLGNIGDAMPAFAQAFAEYVQDHGKALEQQAAREGGK